MITLPVPFQQKAFQISPEELSAILTEYADKNTGYSARLGRTPKGNTWLRDLVHGKKLWENMTEKEKLDEFMDYMKKDFQAAKQEAGEDKIGYLLQRALDFLDPMSEVYKLILKKAGAKISPSGEIKLPPYLERKNLTVDQNNNLQQKEPEMNKLSSYLDKIAESLEKKGFIKEAREIDVVSNTLDKEAGLPLTFDSWPDDKIVTWGYLFNTDKDDVGIPAKIAKECMDIEGAKKNRDEYLKKGKKLEAKMCEAIAEQAEGVADIDDPYPTTKTHEVKTTPYPGPEKKVKEILPQIRK